MTSAWEDRYLCLKDEHDALKKKSNEQVLTIKKMYTKLAMIDETLKRRREGDPSASVAAVGLVRGKENKETKKLLASLRKENQELKRRNLSLAEKLRGATQRLAQMRSGHAVGSAKGAPRKRAPPGATRTAWGSSPSAALASGAGLDDILQEVEAGNVTKGLGSAPRMRELVAALRQRLLNTEERMQRLHQQNNAMRQRLDARESTPTTAAQSIGDADLLSLQREIKDKGAQLTIVKSRYDHLESKARAAAEIHERTVHMMEEGNRTIRDLRRKVQALQHENEALLAHQRRAEELAEELRNVREESRLLEVRMTELCESPFINDAYESRSRVTKLLELEKNERQQRVQIEHLKETAKMHHAEILTLKNTAEQLAGQREKISKENEELRLKLEQVNRGAGLLQDKMRLYAGEGGVDATELEQALTIVKRKTERIGEVDFLERAEVQDFESTPGLRRKVQELQVAHLNSARELERAERMLKAQTAINRDLTAEVSDLQARMSSGASELQRKLDDFETLAAKRLQRIHTLEAQLKQLMYTRHSRNELRLSSARGSGDVGDDSLLDDDGAVSLSPSDLGDFGPGENLVEIWVVEANLSVAKVDKGATTFVMVDFYDYETQTSPLLTGLNPDYNFAATYKVETDHFFLRYLASERLILELNQTRHTDFELLGQCSISLRPLLETKGRITLNDAEVLSARDGSLLGTVKLRVRLALPVAELFEVYLREHPTERDRIKQLRLADREETAAAEARAKSQNHLEVAIISATGLSSASGAGSAPSAYVHYQLVNMPDAFTAVVPDTADPVFDDVQAWPLTVDRKLLRFLSREELHVSIFDDDERHGANRRHRGSDSHEQGLLGTARIPLAALATGQAISGAYEIVDVEGRRGAGAVRLRVAWRMPLALADLGGPMALSADQMRDLVARFDREKDGRVAWRAFLRFAMPVVEVAEVQARLRAVLGRAKDRGVDYAAAFSHFDKDGDGRLQVAELRQALQELRFELTEREASTLQLYLDEDGDGRVSYYEFLDFATPPEGLLYATERKLRSAFAEIRARGELDIEGVFEDRDVDGLLSKRDFNAAMRDLGFLLVDEPEHGTEPRLEPDWSGSPSKESVPKGLRFIEEEISARDDENARLGRRNRAFDRSKAEFEERMANAREASSILRPELEYTNGATGAATRFQARYRGYRARKSIRDGDGGFKSKPAQFVEAEAALAAAIASRSKGRTLDLRAHFRVYDSKSLGVVSVNQFEMALNKANLGLASSMVEALARHFTVDNDDSSVDYLAFIAFAHSPHNDIGVIADQLRNMMLRLTTTDVFSRFDENGDGVITRREFQRGLKDLGFQLQDAEQRALMDIFDVDGLGEIDYQGFVTFAKGQPMATTLAKVEGKLRTLLDNAVAKGVNLRKSFAHFDRNGDGLITRTEFRKGLRELKFDLTAYELKALFARFDPQHRGEISFDDFVAFVEQALPGTGNDRLKNRPQVVDMVLLRKRCQNVIRNAAARGVGSAEAFEHYDWRRKGRLKVNQFHGALERAGFYLSASELKSLVDKFGRKGRVEWRDFIEWATSSRASVDAVAEKLRFLVNKSAQQAGNFRQPFKLFDTEGKGEISRRDFREGMKQLKWDLTDEEVRALMEKFDSDGDGYIQYEEFVQFVTADKYGSKPSVSRKDTRRGTESYRTELGPLVNKLRKAIDKRSSVLGSRNALFKVFASMDKDGNGRIDQTEFERATYELGLDLSAKEVRQLIECFDFDGDGLISYREFISFMDGECASNVDDGEETANVVDNKVEDVAVALKRLVHKAQSQGVDFSESFKHFDEDYSGDIDLQEFRKGLQNLKYDLSIEQCQQLMAKISGQGTNKIKYREFLSFIDPSGSHGADKTAERLRRMIRKRARKSNGTTDFKVPFRHFEQDNDGNISRAAFRRGLELLEFELKDWELRMLLDKFDEDCDGKISFSEFRNFAENEEDDVATDEHSSKHSATGVVDILDRLRQLVRKASREGVSMRESFYHFDVNEDGRISAREFKEGLRALRLDIRSRDVDAIVRRFDSDGNGKIDYHEFVKMMKPGRHRHSRDLWRLEEKLRVMIWKQAKKRGDMRKPFSHFDRKRKGRFSLKELRKGVVDLGIEVSSSDAEKLFEMIDLNNDGEISYNEFAVFVRDPDYRDVEARLTRLLLGAGAKWDEEEVDLKRVFRKVDRDGSGTIERKELMKAAHKIGLPISDDEARRVIARYDADGDGHMQYREFVAFIERASQRGNAARFSLCRWCVP